MHTKDDLNAKAEEEWHQKIGDPVEGVVTDRGLYLTGAKKQKSPKGFGWLKGVFFAVLCLLGLGGGAYLARHQIGELYLTHYLYEKSVSAYVKIDKLDHKEAKLRLYLAPKGTKGAALKSDAPVRFDDIHIDYDLNFSSQSQKFLLKNVHVSGIKLSAEVSEKGLSFGFLDKLITDLLAPSKPAKPLQSLTIENTSFSLKTDYGQFDLKGGAIFRYGILNSATIRLNRNYLNGPNAEGVVRDGLLTLISQGPDKLSLSSRILVEDLRIFPKAEPSNDLLPTEEATLCQAIFVEDSEVLAEAMLTTRQGAATRTFDDALVALASQIEGPIKASLAVKGAGFHGAFGDVNLVESRLGFDGDLSVKAPQHAQLKGRLGFLGRAGRVQINDSDSQNIWIDANALLLDANFSLAKVEWALDGELNTLIDVFRQSDIYARNLSLKRASLVVKSAQSGLVATLTGAVSAQKAGQGPLNLDALGIRFKGTLSQTDESLDVLMAFDAASDNAKLILPSPPKNQTLSSPQEPLSKPLQDQDKGPEPPLPPRKDIALAMERAFERFSVKLKGGGLHYLVSDRSKPPRITLSLKDGLEARFADGGRLEVKTGPDGSLLSTHKASSGTIRLEGGELPQFDLKFNNLRSTSADLFQSLSANYELLALLDHGPIEGLRFTATGRLKNDLVDGLSVTSVPINFTATSISLGSTISNVAGTLTPDEGHFLGIAQSGLNMTGRLTGLTGLMTAENAQLNNGALNYSLTQNGQSGLKARLDGINVSLIDTDAGDYKRFAPLSINGSVTMIKNQLAGEFALGLDVKAAELSPLAKLDLSHDLGREEGRLLIQTGVIDFTKGPLTPHDISPLLTPYTRRQATGQARFDGQIGWRGQGVTSFGTLTLDQIGFVGATHVAEGLNAKISFDSLTPLSTPNHQMLSLQKLTAGIDMSELLLDFKLSDQQLLVNDGTLMTKGGGVKLDPMRLDLTKLESNLGTIRFSKLDLGAIIEASDLKDSVKFEGTLSGALPFSLAPLAFKIIDGKVFADRPGKISISRQAVTNLDGGGGNIAAQSEDGTQVKAPEQSFSITDIAYQAMEYLSFDQLDGTLNSIKDGVLDINFHIKGRFDPPIKQQTKVSLYDLLSGRFVNKPIKLQSGAPVELYLNVPLKLDDLLSDLDRLNRQTAVTSKTKAP